MTKGYGALERLALERSERVGLGGIAKLCEIALEACGAESGEIALRGEGNWWVAGGFSLGSGEGLSAEDREKICAIAAKKGPSRIRLNGAEAMAFPLLEDGAAVGAFLALGPAEKEFSPEEFEGGKVAAAIVSEKIRSARMFGLLSSRFALAALAGIGAEPGESVDLLTKEPERAAKLLAKGFCSELGRCGFSPKQALSAGIELIGEATKMVDRHGKRQAREAVRGQEARGGSSPKGGEPERRQGAGERRVGERRAGSRASG